MPRNKTQRSHRQKGGTLLESVLTLVVFLALFIGIFDAGTMLFVHQTLTDRARNAARWGAVNAFNATSIQNLVLYGAITPAQGQTASFGLSASNVTVTRPAASVGQPEDRIIVTVTYPVSLISVFLGQSATWSGSSVPSWNLQIQVSTPYEVPS
ncbi:MAG TPA: TadE family protein [Bryobacteraceae bacterium]|nr:TadE family protein [Bryobacteraceae bacterium]